MLARTKFFMHRLQPDRNLTAIMFAVAFVCGWMFANSYSKAANTSPSPATAVAQFNGSVIELPAKTPSSLVPQPLSRQTGLRISVDARWTNTFGYRPVQVTLTSPLGAAKVDRSI